MKLFHLADRSKYNSNQKLYIQHRTRMLLHEVYQNYCDSSLVIAIIVIY